MDDVMNSPVVEYKNTGTTEVAEPKVNRGSLVQMAEVPSGDGLDLNRPSIVRQMVAEFIGVFAIIFMSVSSAYWLGGIPMGSQLVYGGIVAAMVAAFAAISGGQLNPAVTLGLLVGGRLSVIRSGCIIVVQIIAAVIACMMLKSVLGKTEIVQTDGTKPPTPIQSAVPEIQKRSMAGQPVMTNDARRLTNNQGMLVEGGLAFFWVTAFYGAVIRGRSAVAGGLVVGLVVLAGSLSTVALTGGVMNPLRAFGPAFVTGTWEQQADYWIGQMVGGALEGLVCGWILLRDEDVDAVEDGTDDTDGYVDFAR